ncbi:MAG: type II toxin-antitoxin system VapC family toxin [bacterium]
MATKKPKLLDSFAVLRWTQKEKGWERIKALLESAETGGQSLIMSQMNVCEVYYKSIRVIGPAKARKFLEAFYLLPIAIVHPSDELIWKAAEIKADHPISLADCFAIATALQHDATIITGDPEFQLVQHLVEIEWLSSIT